MKKIILIALLSITANAIYANNFFAQNDSINYYYDTILNRKVYTKVDEMPTCNGAILSFLAQLDYRNISLDTLKNTNGKVAFIIEPDGSIKQAWIITSINKAIDQQVITKIKRKAKLWTIGKHQGKAVPVEIQQPYKLSIF